MRKAVSILLVSLCVLGMSTFISANEVAEGAPQTLAVDVPGTGMVFMRLRVTQDDMSLIQMRELIWERLAAALSPGLESGQPLNGDAVTVRFPKDARPAIFVDDHLIVEVDAKHAALNESTQEALAEVWAANLSLALDRWAHINRPLR